VCETSEKQCWSYLRNINTAINYFLQKFLTSAAHTSNWKNLAAPASGQKLMLLRFQVSLYGMSFLGLYSEVGIVPAGSNG
jgi:hypothetical protein